MRRAVVIPALAAAMLAASTATFDIPHVQADTDGPEQVTIMGDSHVSVMIDSLYPGAHRNGNEGTVIDGKYRIYALNGIKLQQVVSGKGVVKAGVHAVGRTNVRKWRSAISKGPNTIVVNLGTNDGGPRAKDIKAFMRLAGKERDVYWVMPHYRSCPICRDRHDRELKAAAKRFANLHLIPVRDLRLKLASDRLHAGGKANSRALWSRIKESIKAE